jgi:hypothetical protein
MAQNQAVYSINIVGYINLQLPTGFSLIANQLNANPTPGNGNRVVNLLPAPPNNTAIFKFNKVSGGFDVMNFVDNAYDSDAFALNPGEGAFVSIDPEFAPTGATFTFVGEVIKNGGSVPIDNGFQVVSSLIPQTGPLGGVLEFAPKESDVVFRFNNATGGYDVANYVDGAWDVGGDGPSLRIGEAIFLASDPLTGAHGAWVRSALP